MFFRLWDNFNLKINIELHDFNFLSSNIYTFNFKFELWLFDENKIKLSISVVRSWVFDFKFTELTISNGSPKMHSLQALIYFIFKMLKLSDSVKIKGNAVTFEKNIYQVQLHGVIEAVREGQVIPLRDYRYFVVKISDFFENRYRIY